MTIHHETEIIATAYDQGKREHRYTIARGGKRWTVAIPEADLDRFPLVGASAAVNKMARRKHVATRLEAAIQGPADE